MELEVLSSITAEAEVKSYTLVGDDIYVKRYTNENVPEWYRQLVSDIIAADGTITDINAAVDYLSTLPAGYNQKITELQAADTTINTSLTSLVATTGSHTAAIADLNITKVDATSAAAIAQTTVGSYFASADAGAWFTNKISTYASDIAANAMDISTLSATVDGHTVSIDTVESVNIAQTNAITSLTATVNTLSTDIGISIAELQAQIDGSISTYFYDYAPTLNNLPASGWSTAADKLAHVGDLFYDKTTGYGYRFAYEDIEDDPDMGVIFSWIRITDVDVVTALANASIAQATADGKRTVFYGSTTPEPRVENGVTIPIEVGDLWVNSTTKVTKVAIAVTPSVVWGDITNTATENALLAISVLEETNDGVVNTFYQANAPTVGMSYGDWWVETDVLPIKPYRYEDVNGKNTGAMSWVYKDPATNILANAIVTSDTAKKKVDEVVAGTLAINITNATVDGVSLPSYVAAEIDKEVVVFTGTDHTLQTGMKLNDIYIEKTTATSSSGTVLDVVNTWKYNGAAWVQISNNDNLTRLADKTDGKRTVYSGNALPTGSSANPLAVNDLFIPTSTFTAASTTYVLNEMYRYSGSGWVKATRYDEIQTALMTQIDGKIETYYGGATPPFPNQVNVLKDSRGGDYWYCDVDGTYTKGNVYKYVETANGSNYNYTWTLSADVSKSAFDLADKKRIIFGNAGTSIPTVAAGLAVSDIWIPSADGNGFIAGKVYKCTAVNPTVTWAEVDYTDDTTANAKSQIIYSSTTPTIGTHPLLDVGDQWVNTADGLVKVWNGTAWVDVVAKSTAEVLQQLADLEEARDGNIVVFYETSTTIPTGMTYGDYLVDTDSWSGSMYTVYRYENSVGGSAGTLAWYVNTGDTARSLSAGYRAQVLAGTAQTTADGKVKTWYQTSAPTGLTAGDVGDIWVDTDDGNKVQIWSGSAWVDPTTAQGAQAYTWSANASKLITNPNGGITGWSFADSSQNSSLPVDPTSQFRITADLFELVASSQTAAAKKPFTVNAATGNITFNGIVDFTNTNSLGTTTINGGKITTGTVTADQIAASTIIGSKIAADTITGANIAAGTITADEIAASTITGDKIAANTVDAASLKVNTAWVSGIVQSSDFTTIGGTGFRLNAEAASTSADPDIYGAYIRGGTIDGTTINASTINIRNLTLTNDAGNSVVPFFIANISTLYQNDTPGIGKIRWTLTTGIYTYNSAASVQTKLIGATGGKIFLYDMDTQSYPQQEAGWLCFASSTSNFVYVYVTIKCGTSTIASKTSSWTLGTVYEVGGIGFKWKNSGGYYTFQVRPDNTNVSLSSTSSSPITIEIEIDYAGTVINRISPPIGAMVSNL